MLTRIRSGKGFTLVELMIVVAIIGILAAIAIPNFLNFRLKSKSSEAKSNLGAIRTTEIAFFAEWNSYVSGQAMTPVRTADASGAAKLSWDATTRFSLLGFAPEGKVFFSYNLDGGTGYDGSGFTCNAYGNLDGDSTGEWSYFTISNALIEITHGGAPY